MAGQRENAECENNLYPLKGQQLRAVSSAVERLVYTELVGGSNPSSPIRADLLFQPKQKMNSLSKTLLILCGALVVSATGLQAQGRSFGGRGFSARPLAERGYNHGGYYGNRGRFFYLGGIPYFYPFGFGFGYPYDYGYYGGYYGDGYGYGGGYPGGAGGYGNGAYNGGIADGGNGPGGSGPGGNGGQAVGGSLPEAVQRQLAKRGYYKGAVDGQFGAESRDALSRFQKKQGLKQTGRVDEPTLEALGFTDRR